VQDFERRVRSGVHWEFTVRVFGARLHRSVIAMSAARADALRLAGGGSLRKQMHEYGDKTPCLPSRRT